MGDGLFAVGVAAGFGTENVTDTVEFILTSNSVPRVFWESIFCAENRSGSLSSPYFSRAPGDGPQRRTQFSGQPAGGGQGFRVENREPGTRNLE